MNREEITKKLESVDTEQVKAYITLFDRMLLQLIASKLADPNEIKSLIEYWQKQIKLEINMESSSRNNFLMGTPLGRLVSHTAKVVEDGEALRLDRLGAMEVASDIISFNYHNPNNDDN